MRLGVHADGHAAIPAPGADAVYVCIFDGAHEVARHALRRRTGDVFHDALPPLPPGTPYALRVHGPGFDADRLILDPWATALDRPLRRAPPLALAVIGAPLPPVAFAPLPPRPELIHELHVGHFTRLHPEVPEAQRGTFAGLAHPAAIAHLRALGVTTVELMPCAAWVDDRHLPEGVGNVWGYNPLALLAPDPRLAPGGMAEVRAAVAALREAGIAVILDVVLNHTGEGDALGPVLSLKGLGESHWYRGTNEAGCGNVLALEKPWPLRLAMDALRHWAEAAGVDGFRLDLAAALCRVGAEFREDSPFLLACRQDPVLRGRRMIAEPWDLAGHAGGRFPAGWGEWNDRFRDDTRRFWRGDGGMAGAMATRLAGSRDIFAGRPLADSVNYVAAHDGFTLRDLVTFATKRNEANGEGNRDGPDEPSWAGTPADARALLVTLFAARGTPMLGMGDEAGRSQGGNSNAWCQDFPLAWPPEDPALLAFVRRLSAARAAHPALHGATPLAPGTACWLHPDGTPFADADWPHAAALVVLLAEADDRAVVALNPAATPWPLSLPEPRPGHRWHLLADSSDPAREGEPPATLGARAALLLAERRLPPPRPAAPDPALLAGLATAAGITLRWHEVDGTPHDVPEGTVHAMLAALGLHAGTAGQARESLAHLRARQPHLAPRAGEASALPVTATGRYALVLESGESREWHAGPPLLALPPLPPGRHRLHGPGGAEWRITAAPAACHPPLEGRRFALCAQAYALREAGDAGIGSYGAFARFAAGARAAGAAWAGTSPFHALPPVSRHRASPYQPSDRRFLEPALLEVPGLPAGDAALVDWPATWALKRAALHARFRAEPAGPLPDDAALRRFATFCAIAEVQGHEDARRWPAGLRHGRDSGVAAFAAAHADAVRFHAWLQAECDRQVAAIGPGLYRDLAIGTARDGAEAWSGDVPLLPGLSVGAPPDPLGPEGQDWGIPCPDPLHPATPDAFAALLRANMRHADALRVDHVMGVQRLFVLPDGARGAQGCYLAMPRAALLAETALESTRARCAVVGEDLGTVPEGLRGALDEAGILSFRVLWFEGRPPANWPALAAAAVTTHDLPTLAGWWHADDLRERAALGLEADAAAREREKAAWLARLGLPPGTPWSPALAAAFHAHAGAAPSRMLLVQADDLAGARVAVNLPGTDRERPNWRHRLPVPVGLLLETPEARAILEAARGR